jgi:hypothetical protein
MVPSISRRLISDFVIGSFKGFASIEQDFA